MKQRLIALLAAALTGALMATAADAQTVLRLNNWLPPGHSQLVGVLQPWAKQVGEATKGRVKVVLTDTSLGAPQRQYDLAADGIADITLGIVGYTPGRFKLPPMVDLPLISESGEARAVALWRVHKKYFEKANEFKDVVLLGMYGSTPGSIMTTKQPVTDLASYAGKKFRTGGGLMEDVNQALGGVNVSVPAGQIYEVMSQGVADGALMGGEGYDSFKLKGLVKYFTTVPGGMYSAGWYIVMNKAAWAKLSKEDQDAILSVSGENIARLGGGTFDKAEAAGRKNMAADGVTITVANDAFLKAITEKTAFLRQKWIADAKALGVDGEAALKMFENEAKNYKPATN